jgi:hypothetical protein
MNDQKKKNSTSPQYAADKRAAEVGETAPERTTEKPGLHKSGGELNNGPTRS